MKNDREKLLAEVVAEGEAKNLFAEAHRFLDNETPAAAIGLMRRCLLAACMQYETALHLQSIDVQINESLATILRRLRLEITNEQEKNLDFISRNLLSDGNDLGSDEVGQENAEKCFRTTAEVYRMLINEIADVKSTWQSLFPE